MEILSVNDMLHQKALTFYNKYVNKNLPYYFDSFDITTQGSQTAKFMGPTWGPSGADRTQMGPMLAPWTLLSGIAPQLQY